MVLAIHKTSLKVIKEIERYLCTYVVGPHMEVEKVMGHLHCDFLEDVPPSPAQLQGQ